MIITCLAQTTCQLHPITDNNQDLIPKAVWIDLISPTLAEEQQIEQYLGFNIPTRDEMREIELSSRLYKEDNRLYMTASVVAQSVTPEPILAPITFVLTDNQLMTVRYIEPQSFRLALAHIQKMPPGDCNAITVLIELLDATVDRLADMLEMLSASLDDYSKIIFKQHRHPQKRKKKPDYQQLMQTIGADGDLNTKARESLITFNRLLSFLTQMASTRITATEQLNLNSLSKDITALSDHASFLSSKINFLLDATLGMVNLEQNNIIKIFSVAAVIFLPPTLIASIYGMNFHFMPELSWKYGYLSALGLMLLSAFLPYKFFKYKKWL